jgi:hypothetical protein
MSIQENNNIYQSVKVLVDSRYRNDTLNPVNNFKYDLDKSINRVSRIYVESVQIPFTYYTTTALNNVFETSLGIATLNPGNYNSGTIATALKTSLDANAAGGAPWVVTFSQTTFKVTITATAAFSVITTTANTMTHNLGFNVDTGSNVNHVGDGTVDLSGPRYLVIKSSLIGENRSFTTAVAPIVSSNDIIHTVPVNTNPGGVVLYTASEPCYNILGFKTSFHTGIDFRLEDDQGNLLDLNGTNWSIQFVFELR